jgi:hypothetical protein
MMPQRTGYLAPGGKRNKQRGALSPSARPDAWIDAARCAECDSCARPAITAMEAYVWFVFAWFGIMEVEKVFPAFAGSMTDDLMCIFAF